MNRAQFRVLYREFLFRIVDMELLSSHAEGDSRKLLGQFASLLIFFSLVLAAGGAVWAASGNDDRLPPLLHVIISWNMEHFLIATTMLAVGLFAVMSWESTFPDRRDILVLGPLPIRARTLFLAKVAAVASALGVTVLSLHLLAGITWPLALAQSGSTPAPALVYDAPLQPVRSADFQAVMDRDIAPMLRRLDLAANDGGAGIAIGVVEHGSRRVMTYGAAKPDSLFEIGSITKTFTGLMLAQMATDGKLDVRDHVRELLPAGTAARPAGFEVTLLDLATHRSGLPRMPDNAGPGNQREAYTDYHTADLYDYIKRHGLSKPANAPYLYSNVGFAILGEALADRAGIAWPELLRREITGPLNMNDTAVTLSPEQLARLMQGHDGKRSPTPRWDLDAFASAGGIRSTAGDMLTYLEAQLHPERTPFGKAVLESQRVRGSVAGRARIALAWNYDSEAGVYEHGGATGGFSSFAFFDPRRDFGGVVLLNAAPISFPFIEVLGEHVIGRLAGKPALSLQPVSAPAAGVVRSFFAYWITMIMAAVFMFSCVLGMQGITAQVLPRGWFLRVSAILQLAVFCALVTGYFLQRSPADVLMTGAQRPWLAWIPSYWFVGLYQQLSGSLHPALEPFARRAWIGLATAVCATAIAYAASYFRTLRKIVEQPDIAPGLKHAWLPPFGGGFETAAVQFSIRSLLRSRQHRMILAFYLGVASAFSILFLNAPANVAGPEGGGGPWEPRSVPLLASTIILMGYWVVGARVVFSLPVELRANWIFRVMPFGPGRRCLAARRRALIAAAVAPPWLIAAAALFTLWPWKLAVAHLAVLGCLGVVLAEFSFGSAQKLPFTCSYLPGRSHIHVTFLLWLYVVFAVVVTAAVSERQALESGSAIIGVVSVLALAAVACVLRNNRLARPDQAELRYEEIPPDQLVSLDLSWDGGSPAGVR